jgi:hypothetical protein
MVLSPLVRCTTGRVAHSDPPAPRPLQEEHSAADDHDAEEGAEDRWPERRVHRTPRLSGTDSDARKHGNGAEHAEQDSESGAKRYLTHPGVVAKSVESADPLDLRSG